MLLRLWWTMGARKKRDEKGQATFEFLIFLPFLLVFIGAYVTISGAINGAINQEKATRSYFYRLIKGNPYMLTTYDLTTPLKAFQTAGILTVGYREKDMGESSILPCYVLKIFLSGTIDEKCEKPSATAGGPTFLLKIGTLYGICSATFQNREVSFESSGSGICGLN